MTFLKKAGLLALMSAASLTLIGCGGEEESVELSDRQEKAVSERLAPAGDVAMKNEVASAAVSSQGGGAREPKAIYDRYCFSCHGTGAAGAPKLGDEAAWETRLAKGMDTVYTNAIQGFKGMPPMGLCMDCSEEEIKETVDYMVQ